MGQYGGITNLEGRLGLKVIPKPSSSPSVIIPGSVIEKKTMLDGRPRKGPSIMSLIGQALPHKWDHSEVRSWKARNFLGMVRRRSFRPLIFARLHRIPNFYGSLRLRKYCLDGQILDFGLVCLKVVTDDGVDYIVDAFQDSVELEIMKFHGIGLGSTAENQTDSDIETELTTQYVSDNTRASGTTAEGSSTNIYQTVATNTVDAGVALREHGVLNNVTVGSGVLLDRSVYALINLSSGESLQSTYELTLTAGS